MKFSAKYLLQAALVALLALSFSAGHAAPADAGWPAKWPSSLQGNGRVQDELVKTDYSAEEKRNIMTVLNEMSDESRAAWLKDPKRAPHEGFPGLDRYYGSHDFDEVKSIPDRKDRLVDIIAKGNRVAGAFVISGHHQGDIYGFKGDGKPLQILEFFFRTFDADGSTTDVVYRGEELQLYVAMGGKVEFPKDGIAAQIASNPPAPPPGAAPAAAPRTPQRTPWTTWPPAQWPASVRDNPKLINDLTETQWTDGEKRLIQDIVAPPPAATRGTPRYVDLTVRPDCGVYCPSGRHGFDFIDELTGFHGYFPATSVADRVETIDQIIAKGDRVWWWFVGHGHQTGYFYGFPGDGHPIEWREIEFGGGIVGANGLGIRTEELQLYVAMGGQLQFPGKPKVP
jgi:predicted ester cyclase